MDNDFEGVEELNLEEFIGAIHENGEHGTGCGEVAFSLKRKALRVNRVIELSDVRLVGGGQPEINDKVACGSCNKEVLIIIVESFTHCVVITQVDDDIVSNT